MELFVAPRGTIPKQGSLISEFSQARTRDAAREKHQREAGEVGELFLKAFFHLLQKTQQEQKEESRE